MDSVDTILFDWDGTLIDSAQAAFEAFRRSLYDLGVAADFAVYERIYSPDWYAMYEALGLPEKKWQQADDLWIRHYGQPVPDQAPGARDVLNELAGRSFCLGIVTSGSRSRVHREMHTLGWDEVFQVVVCSEDVTHKKPHPEGLEKAMAEIGKHPGCCCYVGDSPDDIEMAKRAGVRTIGIRSGYPGSRKLMNHNPDCCISSLSQLLDCLDHVSGMRR
jgi:HAD superfamily hydrolase (TIGR01509 family)